MTVSSVLYTIAVYLTIAAALLSHPTSSCLALLPLSRCYCQSSRTLRTLPTESCTSTLARDIRCFAKPPPSAFFDLEAIEAYESQLQLEQQARLAQEVGKSGNADDDGSQDEEWDDDEDSEGSNEIVTVQITKDIDGKRIDAALSVLLPALSRSVCATLIEDKRVTLVSEANKVVTREVMDVKKYKVQAGQVFEVSVPQEEAPYDVVPQDIPLDVLFEDEHMIVINKAADMVVHPAAGNWDGTIVNALAYYFSNKSKLGAGDIFDMEQSQDDTGAPDNSPYIALAGDNIGKVKTLRPGIVHRLDKGTTGVLVIAKTRASLAALSDAFASRKVKKTYITVAVGNPGDKFTIDKPIGRHPIHRQRMRVVPNPHRQSSAGESGLMVGRQAVSHVETLAFNGRLSLLKVRIETGRTHQIRVHLQDNRTPVYGDPVYGLSDWNARLKKQHSIQRPLLHAYELAIDHPITGERMKFCAPMPPDMAKVAKAIYPSGPTDEQAMFARLE
jgi:23S rRNA pseudouridine1911/1915/1917 synthase